MHFMKSQDVKKFREIFAFLKILTVNLLKFSSESFYRDTDRRFVSKFCQSNLADGKSVKSCVAYLTKINKNSSGSQAVATKRIAPKVCQGHPPTMYSEYSRFHPHRITFGGVITERVNTDKLRPKVIPIFASSRRITNLTESCIND